MLTLKRPSGRPQGMVEVKVGIKESGYRAQGVDFGNEEFKSRECLSTSRVYGSVLNNVIMLEVIRHRMGK
jgi:hypothetical protein